MRKTTIALSVLGILAVFFAGYGFAVLTATKTINSGANIITTVNLSVYDSSTANVELTFYDWGRRTSEWVDIDNTRKEPRC
jgi:hypothetical protein